MVNEVKEIFLLHNDVVRQRDGTAVIEELFQAVN